MKAIEFKLRKSITGYIMMLFTISTFVFTGCSRDNEVTTYTVTFDADGGSPVPAVQSVEAGKMATVPTTNLTKQGYIFLFWHLSGASTAYDFSTLAEPVAPTKSGSTRMLETSAAVILLIV